MYTLEDLEVGMFVSMEQEYVPEGSKDAIRITIIGRITKRLSRGFRILWLDDMSSCSYWFRDWSKQLGTTPLPNRGKGDWPLPFMKFVDIKEALEYLIVNTIMIEETRDDLRRRLAPEEEKHIKCVSYLRGLIREYAKTT